MRTLIILLSIAAVISAKALTPVDTDAIKNKINEIEDKIATDIAAKHNVTGQSAADLKENLSNTINGAVEALMNKIKAEKEAEKTVVAAEPKGLLTDIFNKKAEKDAARQEKINSFIDSIASLKDSIEAKKEDKKEEMKEILSNILSDVESKIEPAQAEPKGLITDLSNAVAAKKEQERQEKLAALDEIITVAGGLIQAKKEKEAEKEKEMEELREQVAPYINQTIKELKTKFEEAKQEKKEKFSQVWSDIKTILSGFKTKLDKKIVEKDQERKAKWDDLKAKIHDLSNKITASIDASPVPAEAVVAEPKATFLDEITGTSSWQTVTWVLLAVCMLLAIALVGTVFYQHSQRAKYERLDGRDDGEFPPVHRHGNVNRTFAQGPTAPPSVYPHKEVQQF